jgi:hypothetical protein
LKERILTLSLKGAIEAFEGIKWRFYEVGQTSEKVEGTIRLEVPRGTSESYIVEIKYETPKQLAESIDILENTGWIAQRVRVVTDF